MRDLINLARSIAEDAHQEQFRRDGKTPYITHPTKVAEFLSAESDEVVATAWLHDVIEDCNLCVWDLEQAGLPSSVTRAVDALTRYDEDPYEEYIARIKLNPISLKVKIADIAANLSDSPTNNQIKKYGRALQDLSQ
jgi:(p)ppGpp synthase/HD superfamily hydrolase